MPEVIQLGPVNETEHVQVSPDPVHLGTEQLSSFMEHMRHDAEMGETLEEYEADVVGELRMLVRDFSSGELAPHPSDGTFMARYRKIRYELMWLSLIHI